MPRAKRTSRDSAGGKAPRRLTDVELRAEEALGRRSRSRSPRKQAEAADTRDDGDVDRVNRSKSRSRSRERDHDREENRVDVKLNSSLPVSATLCEALHTVSLPHSTLPTSTATTTTTSLISTTTSASILSRTMAGLFEAAMHYKDFGLYDANLVIPTHNTIQQQCKSQAARFAEEGDFKFPITIDSDGKIILSACKELCYWQGTPGAECATLTGLRRLGEAFDRDWDVDLAAVKEANEIKISDVIAATQLPPRMSTETAEHHLIRIERAKRYAKLVANKARRIPHVAFTTGVVSGPVTVDVNGDDGEGTRKQTMNVTRHVTIAYLKFNPSPYDSLNMVAKQLVSATAQLKPKPIPIAVGSDSFEKVKDMEDPEGICGYVTVFPYIKALDSDINVKL